MNWLRHSLLACLVVQLAATAYIAQVRIYIDKAGVAKWKKILGKTEDKDLELQTAILFSEMNVLLQSLRPTIDIQLQLMDIVILDENPLKSNNGQISQQYATGNFYLWMHDKYKKEDYDLAMLFTGEDIIAPQYNAFGASNFGGVCTNTATGVTEVVSSNMMGIITVHEIAHVLGAKHDEQAPECDKAWYEYGNLENTATHLKSKNVLKFSYCSAYTIWETISKLNQNNNNCLNDGSLPEPDFRGKTPDEVCKLLKGSQWALSRGTYGPTDADKFCTQLTCVARFHGKYVYNKTPTPEGMPCGENKRCSNQKCVISNEGDPTLHDVCPWGDQDVSLWGFKRSCAQLECSKFSKWCCETCQNAVELGK